MNTQTSRNGDGTERESVRAIGSMMTSADPCGCWRAEDTQMDNDEMLPEFEDEYWSRVDAAMDDIRLEEYRDMSDYDSNDLRAGEPGR